MSDKNLSNLQPSLPVHYAATWLEDYAEITTRKGTAPGLPAQVAVLAIGVAAAKPVLLVSDILFPGGAGILSASLLYLGLPLAIWAVFRFKKTVFRISHGQLIVRSAPMLWLTRQYLVKSIRGLKCTEESIRHLNGSVTTKYALLMTLQNGSEIRLLHGFENQGDANAIATEIEQRLQLHHVTEDA